MLVEFAIGDAYGAGFEFKAKSYVKKHNQLRHYHAHALNLHGGCYTDDTQMSLAVTELLLSGGDWTPLALARAFLGAYKRNPRVGYATGFQNLLDSVDSGDELLARIKPTSTRNGAAMRALPLAVLPLDELRHCSEIQAAVTHNSDAGRLSSLAVALMGHFYYYKLGPVTELVEFVSGYTQFKWRDDWSAPVACDAIETVHAVLSLLRTHKSYFDLLVNAVALTGDVDTVAALVLGCASLCPEYESNLPNWCQEELENGEFGLTYLRNLDQALFERYPREAS